MGGNFDVSQNQVKQQQVQSGSNKNRVNNTPHQKGCEHTDEFYAKILEKKVGIQLTMNSSIAEYMKYPLFGGVYSRSY
jgi:hypothetical protein